MAYTEPAAFLRDLEKHLSERFGDDRTALINAQREIALDRLLARMVDAVAGPWLLGGDFAMALRFPERPRAPWELNIEWPTDRVSKAREVAAQIAEHRAEDPFRIEVQRSGQGLVGGTGWENFTVEAWLGEHHFSTASLSLDFNYGALPGETLVTENPLAFAGIEPVEVKVMPLAIQAAKLLQDHVSSCARGFDPSRLDKLRDLCLIAACSGLDARTLSKAVLAMYSREESTPPERMPDLFEEWAEPMREMAAAAGTVSDFVPGYDGVVALFDPILSGEVETGYWDATSQTWRNPFDDEDEDEHLHVD